MISHNWSPMKRLIWLRGSGITGGSGTWSTITGNPVTFSAKAAPLKQLQIAFSPVQSGTGDPSPDNVRPISGWSSLTVEQRGKNLFDADNLESVPYPLGTGSRWGHTFTKAGTYYLKAFTEPSGDRYLYGNVKNADGTYGNVLYVVVQKQIHALEVTLSEGQTLCIYNAFSNTEEVSSEAFNEVKMQVSYTETEPESFTPYNPSSRSISISFGQTVYSGWVDVVTGVGEVTMASVTFNGVGQNFSYMEVEEGHRIAWSDYASIGKVGSKAFLSNVLTAEDNYTAGPPAWHVSNSGASVARCFIGVPDSIESVEDWRAYCTTNPIQLVYELAEPLTIQLTPQEVSSLLGDNVVWSTANGDLTVEYRSN